MVIDNYIQRKYGNSGPGSGRFRRTRGEYHASQVSACQRKLWYSFKEGSESDPSVYFELGRVFERIYGAALAAEYGATEDEVKQNLPHELVDCVDRVQQDVGVEIVIEDDIILTGESDWVVFEEGVEPLDKVILRDGERYAVRDGTQSPYEGEVQKVIETKTTKNVGTKQTYGFDEGHKYQVATYMWGFDAPGEIVYMERNDLNTVDFQIEPSEELFMDIEIRIRRHHTNLGRDALPPTTPNSTYDCKYCPFKSQCQKAGGSIWS